MALPRDPPLEETGDDTSSLQPFFLLHRAAAAPVPASDSEITSPGSRKRSRSRGNSISGSIHSSDAHDDSSHPNSPFQAFQLLWSNIQSVLQGVLRHINSTAFEEIHSWVTHSFSTIATTTHASPRFCDSLPAANRLSTAFLLTQNIELFDDLMTFQELGLFLKSHGCHVAHLPSTDFTAKNGIGGCVASLLSHFLHTSVDAADISVLWSWYKDQNNKNMPVVVIIDDWERCCGSVLSEFILLLSEWVMKIPVILITGVATTLDRARSLIQSDALQCLHPSKFTLGKLEHRMDAVVEAILVKPFFGFSVSHDVAVFMRNYFVSHGGTLSSFIRAIKIACIQHFCTEPLSFMQKGNTDEDKKGSRHGVFPEAICSGVSDPLSCKRNKMDEEDAHNLIHGLSQLKSLHFLWGTIVMCLYEAGKGDKLYLLDLLCEVPDPEIYASSVSCSFAQSTKDAKALSSNDCFTHQPQFTIWTGGFIDRALQKLRDLGDSELLFLLKRWERHAIDISEIHEKVKELQHMLKFEKCKLVKTDSMDLTKTHGVRSKSHGERVSKKVYDIAASFLTSLIDRKYMQPIERTSSQGIVCFKNVEQLQMALIGDSRRRIQLDLLESHKILSCSCCTNNCTLLPSMHDTSIMYSSCQEHGDLINLHDWYQSFKSILLPANCKRKHKSKHSIASKKGKKADDSEKPSEGAIQARFCRAVMELQITGLLRMQSKRRPDFVQRVAFGL